MRRFQTTSGRDLCLVSCLRGFLSSSLGKKSLHRNSVYNLFLSVGEDQKRTSTKFIVFFEVSVSGLGLSALGPTLPKKEGRPSILSAATLVA